MKSKGLPCYFARQDVDPFFMNRLLKLFGCFSVARPEEDGIMEAGLVQVHKLYIIFRIRRLIVLYPAFVQRRS